ncbi:MAG: tetraacyldisaccharide 4'-kinase [Rubrivivax sp.]
MAGGARARLEPLLARHWWRREASWLSRGLAPLAALYGALAARAARREPETLPVPIVVVGNLVVGGAGKTPTVIALVQALAAAGWRPGIVSRGHGRAGEGVHAVQPGDGAATAGDEPLLLRRRTARPVWVGRDRVAAVRALLAAHPDVDVVVSDDGLQHARLPRRLEIVVFDERGAGNGRLLPAGPLREPMPAAWPPERLVLYNAPAPSTAVPGALARRAPGPVLPLRAWLGGDASAAQPLSALRGHRLLAAAGIASPERFFAMLEAAGLSIERLPLPDHHAYATLPWPAATPEVVLTEKDAVKLDPGLLGTTKAWVVGLDFALPADFINAVLRRLGPAPERRTP